jgi:hypothetical protein
MMCPICGGKELMDMKDVKFGPDPHDYSSKTKEERIIDSTPPPQPTATINTSSAELTCPMCKFQVQKGWKFCPECGVKFSFA